MSQVSMLIDTLKKQLKAHGKTYTDVAQCLDLSTASVKRIFSEGHLTLQRLEAICTLIDIELVELVRLSQSEDSHLRELTIEQETEVLENPLLLLVAVCVINGYRMSDILEQYNISERQCLRQLITLDRLRVIDLLPGNRIKPRIAPNFRWNRNGPIQRYFQQYVAKDFFQSRFDEEEEQLLVLNGMLSKSANARWQAQMQRLVQDFNELCREDTHHPVSERFGTTAVLAIRKWRYSLFSDYHQD